MLVCIFSRDSDVSQSLVIRVRRVYGEVDQWESRILRLHAGVVSFAMFGATDHLDAGVEREFVRHNLDYGASKISICGCGAQKRRRVT